MFNWFKNNNDTDKRFSSIEKGPARHPYYGAQVRVGNDFIHLKNNHEIDSRVELKDIRRVRIVSYMKKHEHPEQEYWLYLRTKTQGEVHVPSLAGGFDRFREKLNDLPGWNAHKFDNALKAINDQPQTLWKGRVVPDAQLQPLPESPACDKLEEGLWLDQAEELIPWGSYGELKRVKGIRKVRFQPPNPDYRSTNYEFENISILNGLLLKKLTVFGETIRQSQKFNPDWPVTRYWAKPILAAQGTEGFRLLYNHLTTYLGKADSGTELPDTTPDKMDADGEKTAVWYRGKTTVRIRITKYSGYLEFSPECFLEIMYKPDLRPFFTSFYQQNLALESVDYVTLPTSFDIPKEYVQTQNIWFTPNCFAACFSKEKPGLIWLDQPENKLGIGNAEWCRIVDSKSIHSLQLEAYYWRDELTEHKLYAVYRARKYHLLARFLLDGEAAERKFMQQVTALTGWSIERTENRQYY